MSKEINKIEEATGKMFETFEGMQVNDIMLSLANVIIAIGTTVKNNPTKVALDIAGIVSDYVSEGKNEYRIITESKNLPFVLNIEFENDQVHLTEYAYYNVLDEKWVGMDKIIEEFGEANVNQLKDIITAHYYSDKEMYINSLVPEIDDEDGMSLTSSEDIENGDGSVNTVS